METKTAMRATATQTTTAALLSQTAAATSAPISTPTATAADSSWTLSGAMGGTGWAGLACMPSIRACSRATSAAMVDRACKAAWDCAGLSDTTVDAIGALGLSGAFWGCLVGNSAGTISGSPWPVDSSASRAERVRPGRACSLVRMAEIVSTSAVDRVRVWPGAG